MAKKTKAEAGYGPANPGGDQCRDCRWFEVERPMGCEIVEGRISPGDWCKFFHAKARTSGEGMLRRHDERRREMDRIKAP